MFDVCQFFIRNTKNGVLIDNTSNAVWIDNTTGFVEVCLANSRRINEINIIKMMFVVWEIFTCNTENSVLIDNTSNAVWIDNTTGFGEVCLANSRQINEINLIKIMFYVCQFFTCNTKNGVLIDNTSNAVWIDNTTGFGEVCLANSRQINEINTIKIMFEV